MFQRERNMPVAQNDALRRQTHHVQNAYGRNVRAIISENVEMIASTTGLILESRALLARVDRHLRAASTWPPAAAKIED
jgi:hypothetical protein